MDYTTTADYYKGVPNENYRSFVFTDHLDSEEIVLLRDDLERDVRARLDIPFNPSRPALMYEHSMGQGLPKFILKNIEHPSLRDGRRPVGHMRGSLQHT